jgi:hypothetical protein
MKNKIEQLKRDIKFSKQVLDTKIQNAMLKGYDIDVSVRKSELEEMQMELAKLTKK